MPAARGTKRAASKTATSASSSAPKNKKKRAGKCEELSLQLFSFGATDVNDLSNTMAGKATLGRWPYFVPFALIMALELVS